MCVMIDVDKVIEDFNGRINKAHSLAEKRFSENMRDAVAQVFVLLFHPIVAANALVIKLLSFPQI